MNKPILLSLLLTVPAVASIPAMTQPDCGDCPTAVTYQDAAPSIVDIAVSDPSFSTLVTALKAADLVDTLSGEGPFTVFAPTNEAFDKLPPETLRALLDPSNVRDLASILTYHVVGGELDAAAVVGSTGAVTVQGQKADFSVTIEGEGAGATTSVFIDGAQVLVTDIMASNGIIHVIDSVILPATDNIVATAEAAGTFDTLLAAARATGAFKLLTSDGPLTVLAPSDEAFAKLPAGTVENLLKPENLDQLLEILKLHVIEGRFYAADVVTVSEIQPVGRKALKVRTGEAGVSIGGAKVVATDIDASNGVIHVIDTVIL